MPLEFEVRNLEGVKEISSYASENTGRLGVEFEADQDIDQALIDLREAVNRAIKTTQLRRGARHRGGEYGRLSRLNGRVRLRDDVRAIAHYLTTDMKRKNRSAALGVEHANVRAREEVLEVTLNPKALEHYGVSPESLMGLLSEQPFDTSRESRQW